jgi:hypothetical protein
VYPRAVYDIVGIAIAGKTFVDISFLVFDEELLDLHDFVIVLWVLQKNVSEFVLIDLVCHSQLPGFCGRGIFALSDEVEPSNDR